MTAEMDLMGHLMRRAGFGATRAELAEHVARGYDATVENLMTTDGQEGIVNDLLHRYLPDHQGAVDMAGAPANLLFRMVNTRGPLREKIGLFWHSVFATGYPKVTQGRVLMDQIAMFRDYGMGNFRDLLVQLSMDPAMIMWLDNNENHSGAINENYGRELLELFSMGAGNYTEQDVKECARAFTGWTVANTNYMKTMVERDSQWPYGRVAFRFEYREEDHDDGEKQFLGQQGRFNGKDVIDIICRQEATARFVSRHLYHFFVADEPPVPNWPYEPPRDPKAIDILVHTYFESGYNIGAMLRTLFTSEFFKSEDARYKKVKGPAELVAGVLRLTGELRRPEPAIHANASHMTFMGQTLINPPSVEGWHQGIEWIDTGTAVERINYAAEHLGNAANPGVRSMTDSVLSGRNRALSPEDLVQGCLDQLGAISVSDNTRSALVEFAARRGPITWREDIGLATSRVVEMFQMVAATPDFQRE